MIDISSPTRMDIGALDAAARLIAPIIGVSSGPSGSIVHLPDGTSSAIQAQIEGLFTSFGSLVVNCSPSSIPANDTTESTITMNTVDASVDWLICDADGDVLGQGTEAAVAGVVTLKFKTSVAGVYDIWLLRRTGDYATGKVRVTVTEV